MSLEQKLVQKQTQALHMTAQLRHAIKMLELPNHELCTYLQDVCLDNPLLVLDPPEAVSLEKAFHEEEEEGAQDDWQACWQSHQDKTYDIPVAAPEKTLRQQVEDFIDLHFTNPKDHGAATSLGDHLDANGYMTKDITDLAHELKCSPAFLEGILKRLQNIEPTGLFARTLQECLWLQWQEKGYNSDLLQGFFLHQEDFLKGNIGKLMGLLNLEPEEFASFLKKLKECHPKPGQLCYQEASSAVTPDLIFFVTPHGDLQVRLHHQSHPRLSIDMTLFKGDQDKTEGYLKSKRTEAAWMMNALRQRQENLLKLGTCLIEHQRDFFYEGLMSLKPLILKTVALETGLHESTISRLTNHKWALTPFGLVKLKTFFSGALKAMKVHEAALSTVSVKNELKTIIDQELASRPFSDDQLVFELAKKGVNLSRRTVTKYRESLNIPSSYERKRAAKRANF